MPQSKDSTAGLKKLLESKHISKVLDERTSTSSNTILHITVLKELKVWAKFFIDNIVVPQQLDEPNKYGKTPLHLAAEHNEPFFIELFLSGGAHVNARDDDGNTPLHILAEASLDCQAGDFCDYENLQRCCIMLLNHPDIDVSPRNLKKQTPEDIARSLTGFKYGALFTKLLKSASSNSKNGTAFQKTWISQLFDAILLKDEMQLKLITARNTPELNNDVASLRNSNSKWYKTYLGSKRVLYLIVRERKFTANLVNTILVSVDDPFAEDFNSYIILHAALERCDPILVDKILQSMKFFKKTSPLNLREYSFTLLQKVVFHPHATVDNNKMNECFQKLLDHDVCIDFRETFALARAIDNKEAIAMLQKSKSANLDEYTGNVCIIYHFTICMFLEH